MKMKEGEIVNKPPELPEVSEEDKIIEGAIKVYDERGWWGRGWRNYGGDEVCILESVNMARGKRGAGISGVPRAVAERIHRAIWPRTSIEGKTKDELAQSIISWNDGGGARDKKHVVGVLKKALKLKEKK